MGSILSIITLIEELANLVNEMKSNGSWAIFVAAIAAGETEFSSPAVQAVIARIKAIFGPLPKPAPLVIPPLIHPLA
jgi:hypothetical protein